MHGLVVLDELRRVIRPAILWNDQRTAEECAEIEERVGFERLIELTGNRALTGFTAPKLLWLRRHEPEAYARIARVLLPKDYVRLRLTGEWAIDAADASGTLLLDVARPAMERRGDRRPWSSRPPGSRPVLESPDQQDVSGATRPLQGTSVAAGAGDQAAARSASASTGRGALGRPRDVRRRPRALPAYAHDVEARVPRLLPRRAGNLAGDGCDAVRRRLAAVVRDAPAPGSPFDGLVDEAEAWPAGAEGSSSSRTSPGERTPHADPDARGAFVGLQLRHDRGALVRAVLEGVAFGLRDSFDLLAELGVEATAARASGGGARSRLWLRIVASVLGVPLELTESEEGPPSARRCSAASPRACSPTCTTPSNGACASATPSSPPRLARDVRQGLRSRYRALYPAAKVRE